MNRTLALSCGLLVLSACVSVEGAREGAAQRHCKFEERCGNIGSGKNYASVQECLTDKRAFWQDMWPTDKCNGRINGDTLNVCYTAVENTQCNNFVDTLATYSKCESSDVCTAGSAPQGCNCSNGQTCCNNACTNLQTDRNNCGGCGTTCGSGLSCQSGVCK
jgi:hypothetical protein